MKRHAPDGFTLLELLLAISILSLITGSIMGGIHLGKRTWETTRASEALDEVETAARAVAALIARSYALTPDPAAPPNTTILFQGAPDAARFVALSEGGAQWGGLVLTEIGADAGGDGAELAVWTRVYRTHEGFSPPRQEMKKTVVLKNVASVQLGFFGAPEREQPPVWSANWTSKATMPEIVSIRIAANRLGRVVEVAATTAVRQR